VSAAAVVIACGGAVTGAAPARRPPPGGGGRGGQDSAAARLALDTRADGLLILTDVPGVAVDFGKPSERFLRRLTVTELEALLVREPFSAGSMGPKVRAALPRRRCPSWASAS
jgi:carbamate kinase